MKIIGGEFKGRRVDMPKGCDKIRPTSDKVREAIFNIIKDKIERASVLDLFAGSGSLGIEALSRGASSVTFVDIKYSCVDTVRKNLNRLPVSKDGAKVIQADALKTIKKLNDVKLRFDLVFLDPPYYGDWVKKCLINLDRYDILNNPSLIVAEHFKKDTPPEEVGRLRMVRQKRYGDTVISLYQAI